MDSKPSSFCNQNHHVQQQHEKTGKALLSEAKSLRDPHFEFLWQYQNTMRPFADSAGGRTTCLRSLREDLH